MASKVLPMATRDKSARNGQVASYLRSIKAADLSAPSYPQIAATTGIDVETVKRLMTNKADFTADRFLLIANALGVSDAEAYMALGKIVLEQD